MVYLYLPLGVLFFFSDTTIYFHISFILVNSYKETYTPETKKSPVPLADNSKAMIYPNEAVLLLPRNTR